MATTNEEVIFVARLRGFLGLMLQLARGVVDDAAIARCLTGFVVWSHSDIGKVFDVSANVIKQSWVPAGMPGDRTNGYDLGQIFLWRKAYEAQLNNRRTPAKDDTAANLEKRLQQAEVEKAEADAEKARLTVDEMERRLIDPTLIVSAFTSLLSELREELATVGDEMQPTFPIGREKELAAEVNHRNLRILQAVSEKGGRVAQQHAIAQ